MNRSEVKSLNFDKCYNPVTCTHPNKHMKTFFNIREMQIKIRRYYFILTRMSKIKEIDHT